MRSPLTLLCSFVAVLVTPSDLGTPTLDLEVGIPPGSPISWAKRFPAVTPGGPLFPKTGPTGKGQKPDKDKSGRRVGPTVAGNKQVKMDVRLSTSFGVVRIITWDLAGHLTWVTRTSRKKKGPITGPKAGSAGGLPFVTDGLYWTHLASMLRLLLHPQIVSEKELTAHLVEVGEPILTVIDSSVSEKSLEPLCKKLRKMISAPRAAPTPLEGKTPRATMLKRFLALELVGSHPFDAEAAFGNRFFLWADEVEPFLAEYLEHRDSFLRRNAAAALSRYRTDAAMVALAKVAANTTDPVVLMRALSGVGSYRSLRDGSGMVKRLESTKDRIEQTALIVAIGRIGLPEAVPFLLKLGKKRDPDTLMAILPALLRIGERGDKDTVVKFAKKTARSANSSPAKFRKKFKVRVTPDFPDRKTTRGEIIAQLAMLLQLRLDPKLDKVQKQILEFLGKGDRAAAGPRGGSARVASRYPNKSMARVYTPVRMLYLEMLRRLGDEGVAGLKAVARDRSCEPALRGHAIAQLSLSNRSKIALDILESDKENGEMKIYAFEVFANDGHAELARIGKKLLEKCKDEDPGMGKAEARYLWLQALRALGKRGLLEVGDVLALIKHAKARKVTNHEITQQVRNAIVALVDDAAAGLAPKHWRKRIDPIVDLVIRHSLNTDLGDSDRDEAYRQIADRMKGLKGHKGDVNYKNMVSQDILQYLLGFKVGFTLQERTKFTPKVLLEEEILFAIGRSKEKKAVEVLSGFLEEAKKSPLRGHACLALGMSGQKSSIETLVAALQEKDGFVRFCAFESLRHLTGKTFFVDWMYGEDSVRAPAVEKYRACIGK